METRTAVHPRRRPRGARVRVGRASLVLSVPVHPVGWALVPQAPAPLVPRPGAAEAAV